MKVLVTGVAGEWGSKLAWELTAEHEVWGIDNLSTGRRENLHPHVKFMLADLTDPIGLPSVEVILHCAPVGLDRAIAHARAVNAILINLAG